MNISNVNLNLYKSFVIVYETKSISKAGEFLGLTQPTISYNIKELERQLGLRLFVTSPRGVKPTKQADELYKFINSALSTITNGENVIKEFDEDTVGVIRFGCRPHFITSVLLDYIQVFNKKYPKVRIEVFNKAKEELVRMLAQQDLDFVIHTLPFEGLNKEYAITEIKKLNNVFFATKEFLEKNNLSNIISKEQLESLPIISYGKSRRIFALEHKYHFNIKPTIEAATSDVVYSMVLKSMGIGFCIENQLDNYKGRLIKVDVNDISVSESTLACVHNKTLTDKPVLSFIKGLQDFYK